MVPEELGIAQMASENDRFCVHVIEYHERWGDIASRLEWAAALSSIVFLLAFSVEATVASVLGTFAMERLKKLHRSLATTWRLVRHINSLEEQQ
jgi:hypothetical protein